MPTLYDAVSTYSLASFGESGSITFSHTTGTGSDRLMLIFISLTTNGGTAPTSVGYNSVSATLVNTFDRSGTSGIVTRVYRLLAPSTGTNNVQITWGATNRGQVVAMTFADVNQTTSLGTFVNTGFGITIAPSCSVSASTNDLVVDFITQNNGQNATYTVGAGQTSRADFVVPSGTMHSASSTEAGATSVTMSWTLGGTAGDGIDQVAVAVLGASSGTSTIAWLRI